MPTTTATPAAASRPRAGRYPTDADTALMLRVQAGDAGALAELVRRYWARVFGRLYRQLGDRHEAEDLAQEVFLRVHRARERYRPSARFGTWLFHIAQNVARNSFRSRRRRRLAYGEQASLGGAGGLPADALPGRCEAPGRALERAELAGAIRAAVSGLDDRQRRALELYEFHDRTCAQIGAEMQLTAQAAKSLLYRARLRLRASLGQLVAAAG